MFYRLPCVQSGKSKAAGSRRVPSFRLILSLSLPVPCCAGIPPRSIWVVGVRGHRARSLKCYLNRWLQHRRKGKRGGKTAAFQISQLKRWLEVYKIVITVIIMMRMMVAN